MKLTLTFALTSLLLVAAASPANAQRAERGPRSQPTCQDGRRAGEGRHQRPRMHAQGRGERAAKALGVTEEQRKLGREAARQLRPMLEELKPRAKEIGRQARDMARAGDREGARELLRNQLRPMIEEGRRRAAPAMKPLVQSLTPEQRAKLEAAAARRGCKFDEERFTGRLARHLARRQR